MFQSRSKILLKCIAFLMQKQISKYNIKLNHEIAKIIFCTTITEPAEPNFCSSYHLYNYHEVS